MDLYMPICNGYYATQSIRKYLEKVNLGMQDGALKQPYICLLTSNRSIDCQEKAKNFGLNAVITKPIFKLGV